nr:uncharacterized protein LOC129258512 [Lytechinus pictus]
MTPLHAAAKFGHLDLVDFFISEGANVNEADVEGMTPLQCAAARGHIKVIEYFIQHGSDINKRDKRGRMLHEVAIGNGQLEVAKLLDNRAKDCSFEVMSSPNDHTDEGKLSVSSRWGVKESVAEMQSRAEQQAILPNNIVNGKDDILVNTEKKRCDKMSSKVLFEKTHDSEKDESGERNSFLSAKLKSPDQREESPVQLWLESEKKDRAENRNTITNTTNNLITSKYRTWKYGASNPPFLHEMKSNHGTGHPSEEPQSEPFPLTDETRETREPLSSWTLMNAGSNLSMRGTSANSISNLKNLPDVNTNLDNRSILLPSASASTIKCWYPSVLAATRCFLTTILALAVILAGSPALVSGSEITQRIILQAGKPGVVSFQISRTPNTTSKHVPYYTIRLKSQHRPFCVDGEYDVMGLQSPTQLSRFSTSVSTCSNSFPCINLEIDNVNDIDEGIYIFTAVEYAIDNVWRERLEKEVLVEIPNGPAKCFITLSTNTVHPYEVHCSADSGSMKTTLSCYQNNEKLVEKGISTDSVHVTRGVFFLPQNRLFSCCSHIITSKVSAVTCKDFQWPRGEISTTQTTNDISMLVIKNSTKPSNQRSTEATPIDHVESSEGSGATVFHSVLSLVYLLVILTKIIQ